MRETEGSGDGVRKQIETLKELQAVDSKLKEIEQDLRKYPEEVSVFRGEIESLKESLTENKIQSEENDKSKSVLERQLAEKKDSIGKTEERLLLIKNHKEYEALQTELTEAKKNCIEIEEAILETMQKTESLNSEAEQLKKSLGEKQTKYAPKIEEYEKIIKELETKHVPLRSEKEKITGALKPDAQVMYEKISKKTGAFLALASNEMCTNCNMNIPPQMFNEVLTQTKIVQCPNCNRILHCEN